MPARCRFAKTGKLHGAGVVGAARRNVQRGSIEGNDRHHCTSFLRDADAVALVYTVAAGGVKPELGQARAVSKSAAWRLKPRQRMAKADAQRAPGGLIQPAKAGFAAGSRGFTRLAWW
jgi:hypothetical protein